MGLETLSGYISSDISADSAGHRSPWAGVPPSADASANGTLAPRAVRFGQMTSERGERIWEVFRQEDEGDPMVHSGNVNAPDEELAMHYAREFYGRRGESNRLWIVPRDAITELEDPDLLKPPFDRSHKKPGGYIIKHKLEAAKARAASEVGE